MVRSTPVAEMENLPLPFKTKILLEKIVKKMKRSQKNKREILLWGEIRLGLKMWGLREKEGPSGNYFSSNPVSSSVEKIQKIDESHFVIETKGSIYQMTILGNMLESSTKVA